MNETPIEFKGRGYATYKNAARVLIKYKNWLDGCRSIVAVNSAGRFFPVVIYNARASLPIPGLIKRNICIIN